MKRIVLAFLSVTSCTYTAISRKTYVKLINNTPFTVSISNFQTPRMDTPLTREQYGFFGQPVAKNIPVQSGQTLNNVVFFERNVGISSGKEYQFSYTVTLPYVGPVVLEQRIVGKAINSAMYLSAKTDKNSTVEQPVAQSWKEADRQKSSIKVKKDNHIFTISFNAYDAGPGTDDVWYTIDYMDENTYKMAPVSNNGLNVLVYNIAGLIAIPRFQLGQQVRASIIPQEIGKQFDAVIICEAYEKATRDPLIKGLQQQGYTHISAVVGLKEAEMLAKGVGAGAAVALGPIGWLASRITKDVRDGGVLIASKWPIIKEKTTIFKACDAIDCNANKGAIYVAINKNNTIYHLIGLHTNAQWEKNDGTDKIRDKQFQETYEFIKQQNIPATQPVIIGGDLNVNMYAQREYQQMLRILHAAHPMLDGPYKYTWDPAVNKLDPQTDLNVKELLDYVLYSTDHRQPTRAFNRVMLFKAHADWSDKIKLKDQTSLFDLSDHFPVYGHFVFEGY